MYKYPMKVFWHQKDNCYYAQVIETLKFKRLFAFGDTPEKAIKELQDAITLAI